MISCNAVITSVAKGDAWQLGELSGGMSSGNHQKGGLRGLWQWASGMDLVLEPDVDGDVHESNEGEW